MNGERADCRRARQYSGASTGDNRWVHVPCMHMFLEARGKRARIRGRAGGRKVGLNFRERETWGKGPCKAEHTCGKTTRRVRLVWSRTPASHAGSTGSNPVRGTFVRPFEALAFLLPPPRPVPHFFACGLLVRRDRFRTMAPGAAPEQNGFPGTASVKARFVERQAPNPSPQIQNGSPGAEAAVFCLSRL